ARRDEDNARLDLDVGGGQHEYFTVGVERRHTAARLNRRLEGISPRIEVVDQLAQVHESVGVGTPVPAARQPDTPVRSDKTEGVPPPRPPRLRHATGLEHDMVDI